MIVTKFNKNFVHKAFSHLKTSVFSNENSNIVNYSTYHNRTEKLLQTIFVPHFIHCKNYCQNSEFNPRVTLPAFTNDPPLVWPSFFKTLKNFIQVNFIIRRYFDKDLTISEFIEGSKQVSRISIDNKKFNL